MRRIVSIMVVAAACALGANLVAAKGTKAKPDATVQFKGGSVAVGIGFSWGSGTLTYKGKSYPIKVEGLSVGDVGVTSVTASGDVTGLKKLEDFAGNYTAVTAGATAGGGGGVTAMRNQNGVVIKAKSTTQGVKLKLGVDGVKISLAE